MSIELVAAIFAGIVSLITAVGALIVTLRNAAIVKADADKKDEKLLEIRDSVNGRLAKLLKENEELRKCIEITKKKESL